MKKQVQTSTSKNNESQKIQIIAQNKKASHDYEVLEKFEAGIELRGTEIKSVREGRVNLKEAYILARSGTAKIIGMNISQYAFGNLFNHDPKRERRLLLHKKEIIKLEQKSSQDGLTIIPLSIYIKGRLAKISIGLCKGKKLYDKREKLKSQDINREIQRTLKSFH
ncbi:MAG: SsrA-binding protein SmpB [Brevinemataceae bacterium]